MFLNVHCAKLSFYLNYCVLGGIDEKDNQKPSKGARESAGKKLGPAKASSPRGNLQNTRRTKAAIGMVVYDALFCIVSRILDNTAFFTIKRCEGLTKLFCGL